MNRLITIVLALVLTLGAHAQDEHMTFVGIPINGTIDQFQQKLISKGFTVNKDINKYLPKGTRAFEGTFMGKKSEIAIYYDTKTNIVYSAKAMYSELTAESVDETYDYIQKNLKEKYKPGVNNSEEKIEKGLKTFTLLTESGQIILWQTKNDDSILSNIYTLHLQYRDYNNGIKHEQNNLDDL